MNTPPRTTATGTCHLPSSHCFYRFYDSSLALSSLALIFCLPYFRRFYDSSFPKSGTPGTAVLDICSSWVRACGQIQSFGRDDNAVRCDPMCMHSFLVPRAMEMPSCLSP